MQPVRPHPSVTIPRGFHFHYRDGQLPRTPEPGESHELHDVPPAPRQSSRRKPGTRPGIPRFSPPSMLTALHDLPVPTIEHPPPEPAQPPFSLFTQSHNSHLLAPRSSDLDMFAPPKTPVAQTDNQETTDYFDAKSQGESISRPSTACSNFSDSSMSSEDDGSLESFPSFGGGSASPESENADPFIAKPSSSQESLVSSPLMGYQGPPKARIATGRRFVWNEEMDHHLYRTFLVYLNNPEHTPFKLFPGTHPPLGVCHRVAREAKRTWRSAKSHDANATQGRQLKLRTGSPDTVRSPGSGEATPVPIEGRTSVAQWPPNHATRRRLRELCKRKPSLSAHYLRLMQSRSPSPFESSSSSDRTRSGLSPGAPRQTRTAFNTRDMNVSLVTSTSSAMLSGNPLSELGQSTVATPQPMDEISARPISRSSAHQKSHSLQLGIEAFSSDFRMLASPFKPHAQFSTWAPRHRPATSQLPTEQSQTTRSLAPPVELHAPAPLTKTLKRRSRMHFDDRSGADTNLGSDFIQDIFGAPADTSHRRVRSRGFSLGDMNAGARCMSSVFTQPASDLNDASSPVGPTPVPALQGDLSSRPESIAARLAPSVQDVPPRLGSPFAPILQEKPFSTIPKSFKQHLDSSPAFEPVISFEERLGAVAPGRISKASGARSLNRNFARTTSRPSLAQFLRDQREQH